jgi:NAD(P)-dependent dehydrogenase (short-subunit alcohol dehydrogenase family)
VANYAELKGRVAVVTGAASGIGRAVAMALADQGVRVFVGDFDPLSETSAEFQRRGIDERRCDVRREADVQELIRAASSTAGGVDILVNNAGIGMVKPITDVSEQEWDACLDTNLKGAFLCCKHAIPAMRRRGGGVIVNVSSNAGLLPRSHDPVYSISKAALIALTKSLALCHSVDRIRVNAICPGPVRETRMMNADLERAADRAATAEQFIRASPLARAHGRMIDPVEVAAAVVYLASDAAAMVTGTSLAIDGGKSLGVPPPA